MDLVNRRQMVCSSVVTESLSDNANDVVRTIDRKIAELKNIETTSHTDCGCGGHKVSENQSISTYIGGSSMDSTSDKGKLEEKLDLVERQAKQIEGADTKNRQLTSRLEAVNSRLTASAKLLEAANGQLVVKTNRERAATTALGAALKRAGQAEARAKVLARKLVQTETLLKQSVSKAVQEHKVRLESHVVRLSKSFGKKEAEAKKALSKASTIREANEIFSSISKLTESVRTPVRARVDLPTGKNESQRPVRDI